MDKPNIASEQARESKNPQAVQPEAKGAAGTQPGGMERMVGDTVSATERVGSGVVGGVTGVATDLVHGVGTVAGEAVTVVRDTANSALAGVGSIGETAVHTVTGLLADLIGGLRDIGSATGGRTGVAEDSRSREARRQREEAIH